jgi:hypothetical protein
MAARSRIYGGGAPRSRRHHRYEPDHTLLNQRLRFTIESMPTHSNPSHLSKIWRYRAHLLSLANQPTQTTAAPTSRSWRPTGDNRLVMPAHHTPNPINLCAEGDNAFKIGGFIPEIGHRSTQIAQHRDLADQHVAGEESPTSKSTLGCRDHKYDFLLPWWTNSATLGADRWRGSLHQVMKRSAHGQTWKEGIHRCLDLYPREANRGIQFPQLLQQLPEFVGAYHGRSLGNGWGASVHSGSVRPNTRKEGASYTLDPLTAPQKHELMGWEDDVRVPPHSDTNALGGEDWAGAEES